MEISQQTDLPEHICKNCGHTFKGIYCNLCGEKVIEPKDRKLNSILTTVLISTTFVDNKFLKSLRLTLSNPGFLAREYVDGRRVRYMRPLQMFFILNLVYFLFPVLQMFNASLYTQLNVLPHSNLARKMVHHKVVEQGLSMQGFELIYNQETTNLAKLLVVIFVVLASVPLSLIFRKKNRFYTDHVALAVELTSFNMALNAIGLSLIFLVFSKLFHWGHFTWGTYLNDITLTLIFIATNVYFIFRAAKTFYNQKGKRLVIKAMLGVVGLFLALEAYRFVLFIVTMLSI
ncbi:DUF3667 domain-containing protein [Chryseolinea lacunae]|uniref:DUF3667 domain-containing protein n=1 Tax=Chryseolinea lacunae TaxID=2801331 RepID=A0ABS1KY45_9BACT|nr:DUF3667 domain-containing protein [Chryseolinea lacunae]MBL0744370.1 DUF3667 domain-containing protein [Chryseolinea lacunae]